MANVLQISDTHLRAGANTPADKNPDASLAASMLFSAFIAPPAVKGPAPRRRLKRERAP